MEECPSFGPEAAPLGLLSEVQQELSAALNSLGGRMPRLIGDRYHVNAAKYLNAAAEGYLLLRIACRLDASKLLVRPAIEAMFRVQALRSRPELLYQIAFTESLEDQKWFRPSAARQGLAYDDKKDPPGWDKFEAAYRAEFPNVTPKREKLSLYAVAEAAGLHPYYDSHYRMYCNYAHAALRATGGYLDDLSDPQDTRTMTLSTFCALDAVSAIGADSPNLKSLRERVVQFSAQPPEEFARAPLASVSADAAHPSEPREPAPLSPEMVEYRRTLQAAEVTSHTEYDKAVIALSGGALAITFAFFKEIIAKTGTAGLDWLIAAWIAWAMSLAAVLVSFYAAGKANRSAIIQVDQNELPDAPGGVWDRITRRLNFVGGACFIVGTLFAICFICQALRSYERTQAPPTADAPADTPAGSPTTTAKPASTPRQDASP